MRRYPIAFYVIAVTLLLSLGGAPAQEASKAACFDIITGTGGIQPILLNRCTGQTWMLMRSGRRSGQFVYRWSSLASEPGEQPRQPETPVVSSGKCFTFQGRRFCE